MGPEIAYIEGRLLSSQSDEYVIAVKSVKLIRGGNQVWNEERVTIKREYISQTYERQLSKNQTVALAAVFVVSVYLVAAKMKLFGLGKEEPVEPPCDTGCTPAVRFPRRP